MSEAASQNSDAGTATRALLRESPGFWVINSVNLLDNIAYFMMLPFLVPFMTEQGLTDRQAGYAVSFYTGVVTFAMLFGGKLSDRLGVRPSLALAMLLSLLGRAMFAAAHSVGPRPMMPGLLIAALGAAICQPALYSGVKAFCHPRATALGYSLLYSTLSLGIGLGSLVSPFLRTESVVWGIRGLNWGFAGVMWTATAITALALLLQALPSGPRVTSAETAREASTVVQTSFTFDARFLYFICILIPVRTLFAHQFLTLSSYVLRVYPKSVSDHLEWYTNLLNTPIVLVLVPLFTLFTRGVSVVDVMIAGTSVTCLSTFVLVWPPAASHLIAYIVLFSVGEAMWGSRFLEHVAELAPADRVGLYMGVAGLPWFFAKFTTGFYSGAMLDHYVPSGGPHHPATMWLCYGSFALLSPLGLMLGRRWLLKRKA